MSPKKSQVSGSNTEYFITTSSPKLKQKINIKELMANEIEERHKLLKK
jgi:hypothetical protein